MVCADRTMYRIAVIKEAWIFARFYVNILNTFSHRPVAAYQKGTMRRYPFLYPMDELKQLISTAK